MATKVHFGAKMKEFNDLVPLCGFWPSEKTKIVRDYRRVTCKNCLNLLGEKQ